MPSATEQMVTLLRSIDASLKKLVAQQLPPAIASDTDLDGKYGDPEVKFLPRSWTGESYKGRRLSQCPPELLDKLAETFDWLATKAETNGELTTTGKPVADYKRLDASRARGWAKRLRSGWKAATSDSLLDSADPNADPFGGDDGGDPFGGDDIPFVWLLPFLLPLAAVTLARLAL